MSIESFVGKDRVGKFVSAAGTPGYLVMLHIIFDDFALEITIDCFCGECDWNKSKFEIDDAVDDENKFEAEDITVSDS